MKHSIQSCAACAFALLATIYCGRVAAQQAPPGQPGAIVLPARIIAGQMATLAVLDSAGRLAPHAMVEIAGRNEKLMTDDTGRATLSVPAQASGGMLTARLPGGGTSSAPIMAAPSTARAASKTQTTGIFFPRYIALGDRFLLTGAGFRGDANLDHVFLGNEEGLVLAASPVDLVVLPNARTPRGNTQLVVQVMGLRLATEPITVVSVEIAGLSNAPAGALTARKKGTVVVEVAGTTDRVNVEVRNLSPDVVQLRKGNDLTVTTTGGIPNIADVEITALKAGDYALSARLAPGGASRR